jgi:DNA (cytosine-5)-methyltransferase 1
VKLTVVDLFSGAGGMSTGFHRHGAFEIVGAVDLEKGKPGNGVSAGTSTMCNPTYRRNIGIEPWNQDIARLDPKALMRRLGFRRGGLDVLISCAPCTGFSQKNATNHVIDDPRNSLIGRTADFVDALLPRFLVMENVKELLTGVQRHHYDALRARLAELGYDMHADVHDLSTFGLPQRRTRALLIAVRDGLASPLPHPTGVIRTVRETIGHLPLVEAGFVHESDPMHVAPRLTARVLERIRAIPKNGGSWADIMGDPKRSAVKKRELLTPSMFRARPGSFPDVYGRLWWDRPAITITRECAHVGNGRYVHPEQDRLLTVREMALLQGFPADYVFEGPLTARYNQIGDAVPPLISAQLAEHVATMGRTKASRRSSRKMVAVA